MNTARKTTDRITITIDGKKIETERGRNLVEVANENGIFVPSLCYWKHIEPPLGTCRVCTCKIDGVAGPACTETVDDGMVVEATTDELVDARHAIVEMMFSEGNHFCPGCEKSGNCDLQHMAYEMGLRQTRFPHVFKDRLIDFNPQRMIMEHNRCIKCLRCVKEVFTDDGKAVFSFRYRGNETRVGVDYDQEARLSDQQAIDAMNLCPTGAIIVRGALHAKPFGDRRFDLVSMQKVAPVEEPKITLPKAKKTVATVSLAGCFGCHMSLLDIDLKLLDLVKIIELNKSPLNDIKQFTRHCDIGLIEGGCCNAENVETLREFRRQCDVLVAFGECAIWGGVPSMRNTIPLGECLEEAYLNCSTSMPDESFVPYHEDLPKILDKVYACSEIVDIDYFIPGCPPDANHIWKSVLSLVAGEQLPVLYSEFKYD
ncbi:MAG: 2Fe-2S iron-sulfur cluster binding domain-containing protein [Xanthomonadales bacterium]|nr:(2Fe-2S)-binding protein [Gammaproteobacteria bacterium]MBT8053748.1 (2Fe-2S)-binding protein [Gammaproteobacteria bacterium]NND57641.1 2Fe-2S iron-sulfur cluster binding domain-containing protein [Xanthomonadales bacterium]NNK51585.1 2Fe-2S iron-sulfur cluster binding domain-containing protein [Xanthomonadales bacterium]